MFKRPLSPMIQSLSQRYVSCPCYGCCSSSLSADGYLNNCSVHIIADPRPYITAPHSTALYGALCKSIDPLFLSPNRRADEQLNSFPGIEILRS